LVRRASFSTHFAASSCLARIPLERGRDIALQYGVGPLLAPLFDFIPSTSSLGPLPLAASVGTASPRPLSAASSYGTLPGSQGNYPAMPSNLAPPPIMPGSALRLLNQGRAQGLFTPSTSSASQRPPGFASPSYGQSPFSPTSQTPPPTALKRNRSDTDVDPSMGSSGNSTNLPAFSILILIQITWRLKGDPLQPVPMRMAKSGPLHQNALGLRGHRNLARAAHRKILLVRIRLQTGCLVPLALQVQMQPTVLLTL
jgi:hypothetical protein